jgi:hypothetical protein
MKEAVTASLVTTRGKLQPFLDEGFVHHDRKKRIGNDGIEAVSKNEHKTIEKIE